MHRLPIRSVWAARCALRCAPMAARSLRHLIRDATLAAMGRKLNRGTTSNTCRLQHDDDHAHHGNSGSCNIPARQ
ncbi:hypothetical protein D8B34_17455 [Verminephrobacter eiseniae]|nr:hypothetical protein [Verminephrobacter eiseniae]MCW8235481.1 hypothetical protein [Verminephrobacter eiseniae]